MATNTKEQQIAQLCNLVPNSNPRIIALSTALELKRAVEGAFNEKLKDETARLRYEILDFIQSKIHAQSPDDLKKFCGIYFVDENRKDYEIFPYMLETSFHVKMDVDGQLIILAGSSSTPSIKMEDIKRREIASTTEEVEALLRRIIKYLNGIIEIDFNIDHFYKEFRIEWNLAGLIHQKQKESLLFLKEEMEMKKNDDFVAAFGEGPVGHS